MTHPTIHAASSVRVFGGSGSDYLPIHTWLDATKIAIADYRHRALRHHTFGVQLSVDLFGEELTNADGEVVSVARVAEQHILEDCKHRLPALSDWWDEALSECPLMKRHRPQSAKRLTRRLAERFGNDPEHYLAIVDFFSRAAPYHLPLYGHSQGIFSAEDFFGPLCLPGVPTRYVGEFIVQSWFGGTIPTVADWVEHIPRALWQSASVPTFKM